MPDDAGTGEILRCLDARGSREPDSGTADKYSNLSARHRPHATEAGPVTCTNDQH